VSIPVALDELSALIATLSDTVFVNVSTPRGIRCVAARVISTEPLQVQRDGGTLEKATSPVVLLWPLARDGYALLVDADPAGFDSATLTVTPTSAVLHRLPNDDPNDIPGGTHC
jgi:hypothetical protein